MAADDAAVVVRLQANLKDYEAALKNAVRATERAATAAEKAISGVGKGSGASNVIQANFQKSSQAIANDARMLQFQLNDIFSGIASGQGIRAVQQQLGQIAQQMSGGSLAQGARTMGAALVGMVNPINLAVVAFGALATAAASYFFESEEGSKETNKALQAQANLLHRVAEAYGDQLPAVRALADELKRIADMNDAAAATAAAVADAYEPAKARLEELSGLLAAAGITAAFQLPREDAEALDRTIAKLTDDTENFQASGEDARKVIELLLQAGLGENDPLVVALTNIAGMLDAISAKAEGARDSLKRLNAQTEANDAMSRRQRQERGLPELPDTAPAPERRVDLYFQDPVSTGRKVGKAAGEEITNSLQTFLTGGKGRSSVEGFNKDFAERLNAFLKNAPGRGISIYSGYRTVERQAELWEAALRKYGSPAAARKWVAPPGSSMHNKGGAADLRFASDEARRWAHENAALYGLNFRMGHEPWHIEAAEGVGRMSDDYLEMAGNADAAKVAVQGYTDAQRLAQQQAQQFAGIAQNFFGGLVNDLIAGKDASEAFRNAIAQLTSQLLQMVMNQAINAFFNQMFGVGAGGFPAAPLGGGGLYHGGGTVGLSGRQDGRQFAPGTWAGAPRFASGGMVGLRPGEVPIIAHRGEIIVPNARRLASSSGGGRVDNSVHQQNKISIDMSGSGYVAANSANAKQLGEDIQKMIEVKLVRESRPGGLLRAVPK